MQLGPIRRSVAFALIAGALSTALMGVSPARAAMVQIAVTGISEARGHVRVSLCTKDTFLTETCPYQGVASAMVGSTVVTIAQVPPGQYAAQAFHDDTDQGVVHQNILGVPRERIGFSNDARLHLKGPRFSEAAFNVGDQAKSITLKVRRLFAR